MKAVTPPGFAPAPAFATKFTYSHYLVALIGRAEAAGALLATLPTARRATQALVAQREAALLSARLDASPLTAATAHEVDTNGHPGAPPPPDVDGNGAGGGYRGAGGWASALGLDDQQPQEIAAVEYANLLAIGQQEPQLATELFADPRATLLAVHGQATDGLAGVVGSRLRRTDQALHDGAQGKVLYNAADPDQLETLLDGLTGWLGQRSALLPTLAVAGIVHLCILRWQPFESANGRVARVMARLVLRARGLDSDGLAVPERVWSADPIAYYGEVAATVHRRGDMGRWLERHGEGVVAALEAAVVAAQMAPTCPPAPGQALDLVAALAPGATITTPEYARQRGIGAERAITELQTLVAQRLLLPDAGTQGLRYRR